MATFESFGAQVRRSICLPQYADEMRGTLFEVSAKNGRAVDTLFKTAAKGALANVEEDVESSMLGRGVAGIRRTGTAMARRASLDKGDVR